MEYTQWAVRHKEEWFSLRLNPCCNGIYSMSLKINDYDNNESSLNPCCNGIYSMSKGQLGQAVTFRS